MKLGEILAKTWFIASVGFLAAAINATYVPEMLSATNPVKVKGISSAKVVETIVPETVKEEPVVANYTATPVVAATAATPVYTAPVVNTFQISNVIYKMKLQDKDLSYSNTYKTGKLYYAHNSANLFGGIVNLKAGDKVVNEDGRVYTVQDTAVYAKTTCNYNGETIGCLDGDVYMQGRVTNKAYNKNNGATYDMAMMTCYGTALGGGDATHRFVVYANAD